MKAERIRWTTKMLVELDQYAKRRKLLEVCEEKGINYPSARSCLARWRSGKFIDPLLKKDRLYKDELVEVFETMVLSARDELLLMNPSATQLMILTESKRENVRIFVVCSE